MPRVLRVLRMYRYGEEQLTGEIRMKREQSSAGVLLIFLATTIGACAMDGDGDGDACDGDRDGDGVANDNDACADSPVDRAVNPIGCTGSQSVSQQCLQSDFVQHGQYVKCVTHAANDALHEGLLTNKERASIVKTAAKSKSK